MFQKAQKIAKHHQERSTIANNCEQFGSDTKARPGHAQATILSAFQLY
jgi:hypothetical protein